MSGPHVRVGIVGLGFGQRVHLPAWQETPGCEVVAVCSAHEDKARKVASAHAIAAYSVVERMIEDAKPDVISIAVPPSEQTAILQTAARSGVNVFFEKPLGADLASASIAAAALRSSDVLTGVDFIFPELATWVAARDSIRSGLIGDPGSFDLSWQLETYAAKNSLNSWKQSESAGGGALSAFGSHSLYYLEWFFGPVASVHARSHSASTVDATLTFASGVTGTISISSNMPGKREHRLTVNGSAGTLFLENYTQDYVNGFDLFHALPDSGRELVMAEPRRFDDGRNAPVRSLVSRFVDVLRTRGRMRPGLEEAWRVQYLMDCVRQSAERGKLISVNP